MENRTTLLVELARAQELFDLIITKRKHKILVRWILGLLFYLSFWQLAWVRVLFWIGLGMELILLFFTLSAYFKLRVKIKRIQKELSTR